jgi:hypothetical protein
MLRADMRRPPRSRRPLLAILGVLVASVAIPALVLGATTKQLVSLAQGTYLMTCGPDGSGNQVCTRGTVKGSSFALRAVITPASGDETNLITQATIGLSPPAGGLDSLTRAWMTDMHALACGDTKGVAAYVDLVGDLTAAGFGPPRRIGNCQFNGSLANVGSIAPVFRWTIGSSVIPPPSPSPTPVVTPRPTPTAPPKPTPTPIPTRTPAASSTPKPTATPGPGPSHTPAASPTATPSAAASAAPSAMASATAGPSGSPLPSLAPSPTPPAATPVPDPTPTPADALEPTPEPEATEPPPGGPTPAPTFPSFSQSVAAITDVNPDGGAIGGSLLLALLLLLIVGFAGELFNNTVENNYTEISGWLRKGPLGRLRSLGSRLSGNGWLGVGLFIALTALVSSFVDPRFGLDVRSLATFLGFLVGLVVVLASFKLPQMLAHRRATGELGRLRPLPWALVIAGLFVVISRIGSLQPGYLYGIVLGAIFVKDVSDREEGRETFYGSLWTLIAAVVAWVALGWLRGQGLPDGTFAETLLSTAFAAILVAGLEAAAFGLMPLRFMPGHAVYRWNRLGWAVLFGLSVFAFIHILIGPSSGYVSDLSPAAFTAALGVFAVFGALSIGTWLFFRFRSRPEPA